MTLRTTPRGRSDRRRAASGGGASVRCGTLHAPGFVGRWLHLGGTRVLGILVTMDAAQGVDAIRMLRPRRVLPIHYDDYTVFKSPLEDFLRAVERAGLASRVHVLARGETYEFDVPERRADAARRSAGAVR